MVKYKMSVVGGNEKQADSMAIVLDKTRALIILYVPTKADPKKVEEMLIVDDLKSQQQYVINKTTKVYQVNTLNNKPAYDFYDTKKMMLVKGEIRFHYKGDSSQLDKSVMLRSDCLVSIDHTKADIKNYWFMGIHPIILDNKLVTDFIVTEATGGKPRIYVSDIIPMQNVDTYFDLKEYKQL